jgi:3,4-dihydroxy 2-butanone 4-phosphate synthase/GTP cyclohydrolase II
MIVRESVRVPLPTPFGPFEIRAFETGAGLVYLAMVHGDLGDGDDVLVRLHSECLTGDALGSLRCDCGVQLRLAMRTIAAEQRGVLIYATGQEGRGIGLVNKLKAYVAQDGGADTVDANVVLGLPIDARDYTAAAAVLEQLAVRSVRLLTNNPTKVDGLRAAGTTVNGLAPLPTAPHHRNLSYLRTKADRMGHLRPHLGAPPPEGVPGLNGHGNGNGAAGSSVAGIDSAAAAPTLDAMQLLGAVRRHPDRPYVVLKYAQSLDGRIATSSGDSKWISGEPERRLSHTLRAACDAVLVGVGTAITDRPQLTVRMVPGASPNRVVLDSTLRLPLDSPLLEPEAATTIITTERADPARRAALQRRGARIEIVADDEGRVDLAAALSRLRDAGVESLLVEGGAAVITAFLAAGLVDRMIVGIAPIVLGRGTDAVEGLGITEVIDGIRLERRTVVTAGDDLILAGDVVPPRPHRRDHQRATAAAAGD